MFDRKLKLTGLSKWLYKFLDLWTPYMQSRTEYSFPLHFAVWKIVLLAILCQLNKSVTDKQLKTLGDGLIYGHFIKIDTLLYTSSQSRSISSALMGMLFLVLAMILATGLAFMLLVPLSLGNVSPPLMTLAPGDSWTRIELSDRRTMSASS